MVDLDAIGSKIIVGGIVGLVATMLLAITFGMGILFEWGALVLASLGGVGLIYYKIFKG